MKIEKIQMLSEKFEWNYAERREVLFKENLKKVVRNNMCIFEGVFKAEKEFTKHYLADIAYDILAIMDVCEEYDSNGFERDREYPLYLFGIRTCGVDNPAYIELSIDDDDKEETERSLAERYKRILEVTFKVTEDNVITFCTYIYNKVK